MVRKSGTKQECIILHSGDHAYIQELADLMVESGLDSTACCSWRTSHSIYNSNSCEPHGRATASSHTMHCCCLPLQSPLSAIPSALSPILAFQIWGLSETNRAQNFWYSTPTGMSAIQVMQHQPHCRPGVTEISLAHDLSPPRRNAQTMGGEGSLSAAAFSRAAAAKAASESSFLRAACSRAQRASSCTSALPLISARRRAFSSSVSRPVLHFKETERLNWTVSLC